MKVLHVGPKNFPPSHGGVEKIVHDLVTGMPQASSHVMVEWPQPSDERVSVLPGGLFRRLLAVARCANRHQADVIHLHKEAFIPLAILLRLMGFRCVVTIHGCAWRLSKWPLLVRAAFLLLDCLAAAMLKSVVFVGQRDWRFFQRIFSWKRLWLIPNGVNVGPQKRDQRRRPAMVYLGRLSAEKNIVGMIRAARDAHVPLDIYGPFDHRDAAYEAQVRAAAGEGSCVRLMGPVDFEQVPAVLANYTTFINPSFSEGLPVSVLEAAGAGCQLVLSDIAQHRLLGMPSCVYVNPRRLDLSQVRVECHQHSELNRQHTASKFSVTAMVESYQQLYRRIARMSDKVQDDQKQFMAKGKLMRRLRSILFLLPAWFAPHKSLRVLFHRLRGVRIGRGVEIGYFCLIGNVHPDMVHIDDGAVVTARSTILEHDNAHYYCRGGQVRFGPVHIGRRAFIGIGSIIMPDVTVGEQTIVGALSLVSKSVPPRCVVAGTPARIIKRFDETNEVAPARPRHGEQLLGAAS